MKYIHQLPSWSEMSWDSKIVFQKLIPIRMKEGRFLGRMESLGFDFQLEAEFSTLTQDVIKTSEIEGENLPLEQVRSSLAKRLGLEFPAQVASNRNVDGLVEVVLDACQNAHKPVTSRRLFLWHSSIFPTGKNGFQKIAVGKYRDGKAGPMQVVSGPIGKEKVHFEAPPAEQVPEEMTSFLHWLNSDQGLDPVLKAGVAHLWFLTIHPFSDGNGRMARAISDLLLSRADGLKQRFYSLSAQIRKERNSYYEILEKTQKGNLDITEWLVWFLDCLDRSLDEALNTLSQVLKKAAAWKFIGNTPINPRQKLMLNRLLDDFQGNLNSSKWAKMAKCSQDTAQRDIQSLVNLGILEKTEGGGRSTGFRMKEIPANGRPGFIP
jgi:Fic family protein